jgi:hypothetical protein
VILIPINEIGAVEPELPAALRAALQPAIPGIVDAAIAAIRTQGVEHGATESGLERNVRVGLTDACDRWFGSVPPTSDTELHYALGRAQARSGRSLDELMRIYRIAGQTAWRSLTEIGAAKGVAPEDLYQLAETGFGYVDELSTQAAAGYAEEQTYRSGASQSRRNELVRLLLREPQADQEVLRTAAETVGVELTSALAFFVGPAELYDAFARTGREHFVLAPRNGLFVGTVFDPHGPGRLSRLEAAAERSGVQLALGPAVAVDRARTSLKRAKALFELIRVGVVTGGHLIAAERHDVPLLLGAEPELAEELARRRLAPLEHVRGEATRTNLALTLGAWLRHQGQRKAIAHTLGIHPQTVQYRVARLRELFGAALDDPDERFELELALRLRTYASPPEQG